MITFERGAQPQRGEWAGKRVDDGECKGELLVHGWSKLANDYVEYATEYKGREK